MIQLFRFFITILSYSFHVQAQCSLGCNTCIQDQSSYQFNCLDCASDFVFDTKLQDCVYQKCQSNLLLNVKNQSKECVSTCDNNYIGKNSINLCVQSKICTQNYISPATLSKNQVILDIIPYSRQNYLIKYNGFLNVIDSQSGQFIVSIQTNNQVLLCDYIFSNLVLLMQDNTLQQFMIENQQIIKLNQISQGKVSSSSVMKSFSQDYIIITTTEQTTQTLFLNFFRKDNQSLQQVNNIQIQIQNQKLYIFDSYVMLISQGSNMKLYEMIESNNNQVELQTISDNLECAITADSTILNILLSPNKNSILIFILKSQTFFSYSKLLHSCSVVNLSSNLIKVNKMVFQGQQFLIYQFTLSIEIQQNDQLLISQFQTLSNIIDFQYLEDNQIFYILVLTADNALSLYSSLLTINSQFSLQSQLSIKISNPLFIKYMQDELNQIQLFVAGYDFELITVNLPKNLIKNSITTTFSQTIISNKQQVNQIYFDPVTQLLYSCSQDGLINIWNSINSFHLTFYKSFQFIKDICRDLTVYKSQNLAVLLTNSIQVFDLQSKNKFIYQTSTQSSIADYTIQSSTNYLLIALGDCVYLLNDQMQVNLKKCSSQFQYVKKFILINNDSQIISITKSQILISTLDFSLQDIVPTNNQITKFQDISYFKFNTKLQILYIFDQQEQQFAIIDNTLNIIDQYSLQSVTYMMDVFTIVDDSFQNKYRYFILYNCNIQTLTYKYCIFSMLSGQNSVFYLINIIMLLNIADVQKYTNKSGQVVYIVYVTSPLSYTSLILGVKWNLSTGLIGQESFTFYRNQNASVNYKDESNQIIYQGHSSGNVALTQLYSEPGKMFYKSQSNKSQIKSIHQIYDIGKIIVVKKTLLVFDIALQSFIEEIQLDNEGEDSVEHIQGFQYNKKLNLITCFKSSLFLILSYKQNIKIQNIIKDLTFISNYYLQRDKKIIFLFGSNISKYNLTSEELQIVYEPTNYKISQCVFLLNYFTCQTGKQEIQIFEDQTYQIVKTLNSQEVNQQSFLLADQANNNVFIYKTSVFSFTIAEQQINKMLIQDQDALQLKILGQYIVVFTNQSIKFYSIFFFKFRLFKSENFIYPQFNLSQFLKIQYFQFIDGYVFDRSTQVQQATFQILGNFINSLYLADFNHILYYTDNISQGQIFVFSLSKLSSLTPLKAYFPNYYIRSLFYDEIMQFLCLTDDNGYIQMYFYGSQTVDNPINIGEFQKNSQLNSSVDFQTGNLIIYDNYQAYVLNYNTMVRTYISVYNPKTQAYISNQNVSQKEFLIFSSSNILYDYKNQGYNYQTDYRDQVEGIYQSSNSKNVIVYFQNYFLVYQNIDIPEISNKNFSYKVENMQISYFIDDDIFVTANQKFIHFSFSQNLIIFQYQFDQTEILKKYYQSSAEQIVIFGFSTGKLTVYNKATQQYYVVNQQINESIINILLYQDQLWFIYQYGKVLVFTQNQFTQKIVQQQNPIKTLDLIQLTGALQKLQINKLELKQAFIDDLYDEIYIHFNNFKQIFSIKISDNQISNSMVFAHNQNNKLSVSDSYILLQSSAQLNIHLRSTKQFIFYIRDNFRRQQLVKTIVINERILILQFLLKLNVYEINQRIPYYATNNTNYYTLIDTQTLSYPQIIFFNLNDQAQHLQIIGFSINNIFDFQYDVSNDQNLLSNQCSTVIDFQDPYQFQAKMLLLQSSTTNNQTIYINVNNSFHFMNSVNQQQTSFILQPSLNQSFELNLQSLNYFKFQASLKNFDFFFQEKGNYNFSSDVKIITIENSTIQNQNIYGKHLNFKQQTKIVINKLVIDSIFDDEQKQISNESELNQNFIYFQNCGEIYIYNLEIRNLNIYNLITVLLFEEIDKIQIDNLTLEQNIISNSLINFVAVNNLSISNIHIQNNIQTQFQGQQIFLLNGCQKITVADGYVTGNQNIQFLNIQSNYTYNNTIIYLMGDSLDIRNIELRQNSQNYSEQISNQDDGYVDIHLIQSQTSFINLIGIISKQNDMNILFYESFNITIESSLFEYNTAIEGGVFYFYNMPEGDVYLKNCTFSNNIAYANGGAILFHIIRGIYLDLNTNIKFNKAIIGGGMRVRGVNQFKLDNFGNIIDNNAQIFGQNIATYPNKITIQPSSSTGVQIDLENGNSTDSDAQIYIKNFQSGGQLDIDIFLMDSDEKLLNFSISNFKQGVYPNVIQNEIQQWNARLDLFDSNSLQIIGESSVNYNQFDEKAQSFVFESLTINSIPFTSQQIILEYNLASYINQQQILIKIDFRNCQRGEIETILNDQIRKCVPCNIGQYSMYDYSQKNFTTDIVCKKCPEESSVCEQNGFILKQGYWRLSNESDLIIECTKYQEACNEQSSDNQFGCIEGYVGPLCEQCDFSGSLWQKRFSENSSKTGCQECSSFSYQLVLMVFSSLFILFYLFFQIIFIVWNLYTYQSCYYLRMMNLLPISVSQLKNINTFYIKCLMNYLQLQMILIGDISDIPVFISFLPNTFSQPSSFTVVDTLCIISPETIDNNGPGRTKIIISQIYNLALATITIILILGVEKVRFNQLNFRKYLRYNAFYFLYTFMQPDSVRLITKFLTCRKIGQKSYFTQDLLFECNKEDYLQFQKYFGIPLLVFWIILPAIIFLQIFKKSQDLKISSTVFRYGYFFIEYKKNKYYWEFVRIYLKVLIVIFFTLYSGNQKFSYMVVTIFMIIYISFLNNLAPFLNQKMKNMEQLSFFTLISLVVLQNLLNIYNQQIIIKVFMIMLHMAFIGRVLWEILIHKLLTKRNILGRTFIYVVSKIFRKSVLDRLQRHLEVSITTYSYWKKIRKNLKYLIDLQAITRMNLNISQKESQVRINLVSPKNKLSNNITCQTPQLIQQQDTSKLEGMFSSQQINMLYPQNSQMSPTRLLLNSQMEAQTKKQSLFFQFMRSDILENQNQNEDIKSMNQEDGFSINSEHNMKYIDQVNKLQDKLSIQTISSLNQAKLVKTPYN